MKPEAVAIEGALTLDKSLGVVAQKLETSAGECNHLALAVFVVFVVRLDIALGYLCDHVNDLVRLGDAL